MAINRIAAALLATSALAAPAFAQAPAPAPLEKRVERLEALLQGVIDRLDRQQGATLTPAEGQAVREAQGVLADRGATTGATPVAADQRAAASASGLASRLDAIEKGQGLGFRVGASTIKIGGYFKFDANVSKYSGGDPTPTNSAIRFYNSPAGIPVGGAKEGYQLAYNARETRFSINTETPIGDEKLTGTLELDFLDTPTLGNERVTSSYVPRIRQGFITYGKWTFGQTWSTFQNVAVLPERTDFIGPTEGVVFVRQPIVRYTNGGFQIALEQPETTVQQGATSLEADDDKAPDLVLRYNFKGDWGTAAVAGIGRYLRYDASTAGGVDDEAVGYGVSVSGVIKVGPKDNFNFMITGGEGIGRYVALNVRDDAVVDVRGRLDTVGLIAGFASFRHFWTDKWRSVLTGGYYKAYNPSAAGLLVTDNVGSASFETFYSPAKPLTFGLGYRYARRELENGLSGNLNRVQFSAQYNF
ncbi:DcaP family trimeric outer membrane transporter [Glacieibacterium frigidum]|uniref:Porin n=1 Tax=Glacieibacterium frigidum TaxID=2593303 RepID=A0A552UGK2_9SPHN|nr:DcaP family trimeric outer membrane transporter [Glacieibacterium frigidum]TRW17344.1 hypothetical protein FMM06_03990 [Glacieibacterium frigidum]